MPAPIVLLANHFQFAPGQEKQNPCVGSRMLLWVRQGGGAVIVDGRHRRLETDDWVLMPWRHSVQYRADRSHPFLVGGIHVCPDHDPSAEPELEVPHVRGHRLHESPVRRDARWPGLEGLVAGNFGAHPRLRALGEWIVDRWSQEDVDADQARAMAVLLVAELAQTTQRRGSGGLPARLASVLGRLRADLSQRSDLGSLARSAGCSQATLVRLFRTHLRCSPMTWLRCARMEHARRLLATSSTPVAEVGSLVGIDDPQRFSKLFAAATGEAPSRWRRRQRL